MRLLQSHDQIARKRYSLYSQEILKELFEPYACLVWCEILICQCCFCTRIKGHNGRDFLFMESRFYKLFRLDCCLGTMPCGLVLVCKLALCCFFRGAVGSQVLVVYILQLQRCFCFGFLLVFFYLWCNLFNFLVMYVKHFIIGWIIIRRLWIPHCLCVPSMIQC